MSGGSFRGSPFAYMVTDLDLIPDKKEIEELLEDLREGMDSCPDALRSAFVAGYAGGIRVLYDHITEDGMKTICSACKGTGLTFPKCDSTCTVCGGAGSCEEEPPPLGQERFPQTPDGDLCEQLNEIDTLNDFEIKFCNGVTAQVCEKDRPLTEKQRAFARTIIGKHKEI